jgi:carbamoyltransferase
MYILGINVYHADSSAAIFKDGHLIAASEEERFTRTKHWAGFPKQAIQFCLEEAGITPEQVDHIAVGRDPWAKWFSKLTFIAAHPKAGYLNIRERMKNAGKIAALQKQFSQCYPAISENMFASKIRYIEHHRAHLASAFFASPFEESALLSIDGSGDFTTTMIGHGKGNKIEVIQSLDFPHSMGLFYSSMTQFLGFHHYGDEYKVMGLAPYGQPIYVDKIRTLIQIIPNGLFKLDLSYFNILKSQIIAYNDDHKPEVAQLFSEKTVKLLGPARNTAEELTQYHKDIAASVQKVTEEVYLHLVQQARKLSGCDSICIAGGVAQNSVANGKVVLQSDQDNVYIPSAGHDAGIAMGSALYYHNHVLNLPRLPAIWNAHTGSRYDNHAVESILKENNLVYSFLEEKELCEQIVDQIVQGGVIGWFQGRSEFGPRALGARSILVDPRRTDAKDLLNKKIKRRESFRPFAPSILEEYVEEYFGRKEKVPFMEKVFPILESKRALIPAVTHVDGTGRLQTVSAQVSPRYYRLIDAFRKRTGIPILLNTSFNENEPIVNSPQEAIDCFLRTQMDVLAIENFLIKRSDNKSLA